MKRIGFCLLMSISMLLVVGNGCFANDLMNPTDFSHKVRKKNSNKKHYPGLRISLSIARVHDNQPVDTAFGKKTGGEALAVVNTDGSKVLTATNEAHYDTRRDELGYGKKIREMMRYHLSSIKSLQLVEREDINAIIRELDFSDTGYAKTKSLPQVEMPQYIAKGFMSANDGSCNIEDESPWDEKSEVKDSNPLIFLIRVYDTRSTAVKYIACGTGQNQSEAIKNAVANLNTHMDLLYPDVSVEAVANQTLTLTGGTEKGLAPDTRFYLVRSGGPKNAVDYRSIEYVAACKVIGTDAKRATAYIEKKFNGQTPEIGDWVFYHHERPAW